MEAPKCRICGKREYNHACAGDGTPLSNLPARKPGKSRLKLTTTGEVITEQPGVSLSELSARVAALEKIVDELLSGKRKRSEYMREYQRDRRAQEKADG